MKNTDELTWALLSDAPAITVGEALCLAVGLSFDDKIVRLLEGSLESHRESDKKRHRQKLLELLGEERFKRIEQFHASCLRWACVRAEGALHTFADRELSDYGSSNHYGGSFVGCWVRPCDFATFCLRQGWDVPEELAQHARAVPERRDESYGWPWGKYETELPRHLSAAAKKYWVNFDPADATTAPTSEEVTAYLMDRGVSSRVAETMAQILRADGLRPGPRPGSRSKE